MMIKRKEIKIDLKNSSLKIEIMVKVKDKSLKKMISEKERKT